MSFLREIYVNCVPDTSLVCSGILQSKSSKRTAYPLTFHTYAHRTHHAHPSAPAPPLSQSRLVPYLLASQRDTTHHRLLASESTAQPEIWFTDGRQVWSR